MLSLATVAALVFAVVALAAPASVYRQSTATQVQQVEVPLLRTKYGLFGNVTIGTPPQPIVAFFDWTWFSMYAISATCGGDPTATAKCLSPQQSFYDQAKSSTYKNQSVRYGERGWAPNQFFGNVTFNVDHAEDVTSVGSASAPVIFQAGDSPPGVFVQKPFPFASIYGLGPTYKTDNETFQSAFYQMWKKGAYPSPYLSYVGCYKTSTDACKGADGLQTLGGYNETLAKDLLWYDNVGVPEVNVLDFPLDPPMFNYWAAEVTHVWIGDEPQALNTSAGIGAHGVFDHASQGRGAPLSPNGYQRLVELTEGQRTELNGTTGPNNAMKQKFYSVDCAKMDGFPPLKYSFKGHDKVWEIAPRSYVEEMKPGACVLNVRALGAGDYLIGNFGEQFLIDKYIVLDYENLRIGLAEL